jgi:hypothetical protein
MSMDSSRGSSQTQLHHILAAWAVVLALLGCLVFVSVVS